MIHTHINVYVCLHRHPYHLQNTILINISIARHYVYTVHSDLRSRTCVAILTTAILLTALCFTRAICGFQLSLSPIVVNT